MRTGQLQATDIVTVEKKNTAGVFPNAIRIATSEVKYTFSSFLKRDNAFADIIELWRMSSAMFPLFSFSESAAVNPPAPPSQRNSIDPAAFSTRPSEDGASGLGSGHVPPELKIDARTSIDSPSTAAPALMNSSPEPATPVMEFWVTSPAGHQPPPQATVIEPPSTTDTLVPHESPSRKQRNRAFTSGCYPSSSPLDLKQASKSKRDQLNDGSADEGTPTITTRSNRSATVGLFKKFLHQQNPDSKLLFTTADLMLSQESLLAGNGRAVSQAGAESPTETSPLSSPVKPATDILNNSTAQVTTNPSPPGSQASEPVRCTCETHLEHLIAFELFPLDVSELFFTLFGDVNIPHGSTSWIEAHKKRETEAIKIGKWGPGSPKSANSLMQGQSREITYNVGCKMPMSIFETRFNSITFSVETVSRTPKVPFGESFVVVSRYCLMQEGIKKSRLRVTARVEFSKKVMLKDRIEAAVIEGVQAFNAAVVQLISKSQKDTTKQPSNPSLLNEPEQKKFNPILLNKDLTESDSAMSNSPLTRSSARKSELRRSKASETVTQKAPPVSIYFVMAQFFLFALVQLPIRNLLWIINFSMRLMRGSQNDFIPVPVWIAAAHSPIVIAVTTGAGRIDTGVSASMAGPSGGGGSPTRTRSKSERRRSRHRNSTNDDQSWKNPGGSGGMGGSPSGGGPPPLNSSGAAGQSSSYILALIVFIVFAGVIVTALNVMWMADIGLRLDRALMAVREAKSGGRAGSPASDGAMSESERQSLKWSKFRSDLSEAQARFSERSFASLVSARQDLMDFDRSNGHLRDHVEFIRRGMSKVLLDLPSTSRFPLADDGETNSKPSGSGSAGIAAYPKNLKASDSAEGGSDGGTDKPRSPLEESNGRLVLEALVERYAQAEGLNTEDERLALRRILTQAYSGPSQDLPRAAEQQPVEPAIGEAVAPEKATDASASPDAQSEETGRKSDL
ncbi:hypothetical protein HDU96_010101 [Phlyctochytrium bullatum]|nr:hypothetical protein HDU96_010101 [Phlyctochytrium bullatum]